MKPAPITRMVLYKHGVGFFERRTSFSGTEMELSFRREEMNDILKSLVVLELGKGQVSSIEYPTPLSNEERLKNCIIHLKEGHALRDLLACLCGRRVILGIRENKDTPRVQISGNLVGVDELPSEQPLATALVSVLVENSANVQNVPLGQIDSLEILDDHGSKDLRFFLQVTSTQEDSCLMKIHLSPGEHDLLVNYISAAPTWRVSYRLVTTTKKDKTYEAILLGWGIFTNTLEEDLQDVRLSLVAGMPVSFIYNLYSPFTPERPVVEEENRTLGSIPSYEPAQDFAETAPMVLSAGAGFAPQPAAPVMAKSSMRSLADSTAVKTSGASLGELFQYNILSPVTVGRAQSAMVPILSCKFPCRKELIYNPAKYAEHPIATYRFNNESGLSLERGPVTVLDDNTYLGEAILALTPAKSEVTLAYAVELNVQVKRNEHTSTETYHLKVEKGYLLFEEWYVIKTEYEIFNKANEELILLVEHKSPSGYEFFETAAPEEKTLEHSRFKLGLKAQKKTELIVKERKLISRREELRKQSLSGLQTFLKQGLMDPTTHDRLKNLLNLWEKVAGLEKKIAESQTERQTVFETQKQIRENIKALTGEGQENQLRVDYVDRLKATESTLDSISTRENTLKEELSKLNTEIAARLKELE